MKKRTFFLSLLAALLVLAGCKPELITEENTLRLSQYKVTFEADKGSQTVKVVTSSAAPWTTMSAEESTWLALEKGEDGTTLTITAETNTTAAERRAKVIIVCAGLTESIEVVQDAGKESLTVNKDVVSFDRMGGTQKLTYAANTGDVTCELDDETPWLTFTTDNMLHEVTLRAEPNTGNVRSAKLILHNGNAELEVTVTQAGMGRVYIPFIPKSGTSNYLRAAIDYEAQNGSNQLNYTEEQGKTLMTFMPAAPSFSKVTYDVAEDNTIFNTISMTFTPENKAHENEFMEALVAFGFKKNTDKSTEEGTSVYELSSNKSIRVKLESVGRAYKVTYKYTLGFPEFPFGAAFGRDWATVKAELEGAGLTQVKETPWETEIDHYYTTVYSDIQHYYTVSIASNAVVEEGMSITANRISMIVSEGDHLGFTVSDEFATLLKEAGFQFAEEQPMLKYGRGERNGTRLIYKNEEKGRMLHIQYSEINPLTHELGLTMRYLPLQ